MIPITANGLEADFNRGTLSSNNNIGHFFKSFSDVLFEDVVE